MLRFRGRYNFGCNGMGRGRVTFSWNFSCCHRGSVIVRGSGSGRHRGLVLGVSTGVRVGLGVGV